MQNLQQQLRQFIVESFLFGQDDPALLPETSLIDKGIIDSTGVLELVGFIGERFGVKVDDEDIVPENLESIARIEAYVNRKLAAVAGR